MSEPTAGDITQLLHRVSAGDRAAEEELIAQVHQQLRRLAASHLRGERIDHTLQPTALVNEAYVELLGKSEVNFQDRSHFFRTAAMMMRRILVDHARTKKAEKRGGTREKVDLDFHTATLPVNSDLILDIDRALQRLHHYDARQAQVVEMRFFGGLTEEEIAAAIGLSTRQIKREWALAKAWLYGELTA